MTGTMRFWAIVAAFVLIATAFVWARGAETAPSTVLAIAGIMFWAAGIALIAIGLLALYRWRR